MKVHLTAILMFGCFLLSGMQKLFAQPGFGKAKKINYDWMFKQEDVSDGAAPALSEASWRKVDLPHDWSVKGALSPTLASATGYLPGGVGWYRKKLTVPASEKGRRQYIYFGGVYNRSEVFINGKSLGKRPNGYISFMYDLTPYLRFGEENVIALRVDHSQSADSRWYTGSGIYRDVWLVSANEDHIQAWGVYAYPEMQKQHARLHVEVNLQCGQGGAMLLKTELLDESGKLVASNTNTKIAAKQGENTLKLSLQVKSPRLWSLERPYLYTLRTRLFKNNKLIDESVVATGFRSYTFDPDKGFALNGEWIKLKGVCLHHDSGVLGSEFYEEVWRRRLQTLKELGCNAIRTSHNPQDSKLYKLCDELGLLVMNEAFDEWEFSKRKWLEGWNVGKPGFEGSYDFFKEWGERDLADMVKRDRNHISIFAWSIGNEVDYPNDPYSHPVLAGSREGGFTQPVYGGYRKDAPDATRLGAIAKRLAAVVRKYDGSRPVTAGLAGVVMSNATEYPAALDIAGYNYTESRYLTDHKQYPKRVIYGSENRHDYAAWKAVRDNGHIFGQFLWTGIDYLGESGRWPSRGFYSGLLDFAGFIKPRGHFRQALWSDKPQAYLGTYPSPLNGEVQNKDVWSALEARENKSNANQPPSMDAWNIWNYEAGQSIRVVCYTNADRAHLELNGRKIGESKERDDKSGIIFWDIPYAAGKLEVVGADSQNKELCRYAIRSSGRSYAIKAEAVASEIDAEGGIAQILVRIVDEEGIPVMLADDELSCNISGPASLIGMEAGDNEDMGDYTDKRQRVYHGKMIAYARARGKKGDKLKIRFQAPWLQAAELELQLK